MKNLSFLLLINVAIMSCTKGETQIGGRIDSSQVHLPSVSLPDSSHEEPKSDSTAVDRNINVKQGKTLQRTDTTRYRHYEGLKSFNDRDRRIFDSIFNDRRKILRINDSLIAGKRRELQIEDSLKRLK
jgi:hypothetical protein